MGLLLGGSASAATVITGPGTPETLIFDAHLTVSSSISVRRRVPPAPVRQEVMGKAVIIAAKTHCIIAGTAAASAIGANTGYVWMVRHCLGSAPAKPHYEPIGIAYLYIPPPPAPFWPAVTGRMPSALPRGGLGRSARYVPAPVPVPLSGALLSAGIVCLVAFRRRRR